MPLKDCIKKAALHPTLEDNIHTRAASHRESDNTLSEEQAYINGIRDLQGETVDNLLDIFKQLGITDYEQKPPAPAAAAPEPSTQEEYTPTSEELQKYGSQVENSMDAERRYSNGERIFAYNEQEGDTGEPLEVKSVTDIEKHPYDLIIAFPRDFIPPKSNPLIDELNELFTEKPKPKKEKKPRPTKKESQAAGEVPKYESKIRDEKVQADIKAAWKKFMKPSGNLTMSGLDPEKLEAGVQLVGLYVKAGVYKFSDILSEAYDMLGEKLHEFVDAIKVAYNAYYNQADDEEAAQMDSSVRAIKLDDIIAGRQKLSGHPDQQTLPAPSLRDFVNEIKKRLRNEKITILTLRKIAADLGFTDVKDTELQEMTELAIVETAREIAESPLENKEKFDEIVYLYESQPTISMRSSERIDKQQYSTPIPMSFLMGDFVKQDNPESVLEPSAGNGMLVHNIAAENVIANEIDHVRIEMLEEQKFGMMMEHDARLPFGIKVDAVIMNPPFGKSEARNFDGYNISGLDEQMTINALKSLKPNGRAAIVIGGHNTYDEKGRLKNDLTFFNYLHSHFNVVDVINIDGSLYAKQGTSFPTRIILINGTETKEKNAPLENKQASKPITDFEQLYQRVQKIIQNEPSEQTGVQPQVDTQPDNGNVIPGGSRKGTTTRDQNKAAGNRTPASTTQLPDSTEQAGQGETTPDDRGLTNDLSGKLGDRGGEFDRITDENGTLPQSGEQILAGTPDGSRDNLPGGIGDLRAGDTLPISDRFISLLDEKIKYEPKSESGSVDTVIPTQMSTEIYNTLDAIEKIYGNIDQFVMKELGYKNTGQLFKALSGEQVDAVAMAIHQIKIRQGMIIGDMTGVGKGRIAAAVIRYAVINGYKPIFLTEKPNLFSDLYRDMIAIGSKDLVPFIMNGKGKDSDPSITVWNDKTEKNDVIYKAFSGPAKETILSKDSLPDQYDYTVLTYSQIRTDMSKPSIKRNWFIRNAENNIVVMDESHNASGESNSGMIFQTVLPTVHGVTFLSATFAKRPDNIPVYAMKTAMSDAQLSKEELVQAIIKGGVALQEVVSSDLAKAHQMIRRERTFEGVKIDYNVLEDHKEEHTATADKFTEVIRNIIDFEKRHILPILSGKDDELKIEGKKAEKRKGTKSAGISNVAFASKTFNVINQMLFAIKAKEIAKAAITAFNEGKKPVIGFLSTMESFMNNMGFETGEKLEKADFALVLKKGLEGTLKYTINTGMGKGTNIQASLSLSDLTDEARAEYDALVQKIYKTSSGIFISPIDTMKYELEKAGLRVGEITGRDRYLQLNEDGSSVVTKRKDRKVNDTVAKFNNGDLDVVLLNASGATGLSLHASKDVKDQRTRVLISGQLELDINKEVQKRGRVDRTGQVQRAEFQYIVSAIPAEQRLLMMFKAKLKSLDANTTSSQKSKANELDITDFLNKYGDEVVTQYLKENSEFNELVLDPLKFADKSEEDIEETKSVENAASKVTGRVAILPTREQALFYKDIIEAYIAHINYLKDNNENDLEVKLLPLNAETLASLEVIAGKGTDSPFGTSSIREKLMVDVLTKPMKKEEIDKDIEKHLEGRTIAEVQKSLLKESDAYADAFTAHKVKLIEDRFNEEVIPDVIANARKRGLSQDDIDAQEEGARELMQQKMQREENKYNFIFGTVKNTFESIEIGKVYSIPLSTRIETNIWFSPGVFLGFNIRNSATNKFTPSNIIMRFAVNDSRRIVNTPVSKKEYLYAIKANTYQIGDRDAVRENWDKRLSDKTRDIRYMITGNLLQGYGTHDGQLVAYTTMGGKEIKKGILLPSAYNPNTQKLRQTFSQAFTSDTRELISIDKKVSLRARAGGYELRVPLSKNEGGKFFLNPDLRKLVEYNDFQQHGGNMVGFIEAENILEALKILDSLGVVTETQPKGEPPPRGRGGISGLSSDYQLGTKITLQQLGINEGDSFQTIVQKLGNYPGEFSDMLKFILNTPGIENIKVRNVTEADKDNYLSAADIISGKDLQAGYIRINDNPDALEEDKGTLLINPDTNNQYYALVHEALHWYTFDSGAKELYGNKKLLRDLETIFNIINRTSGGFRETLDTYGLSNFNEFLAELTINPDFRANVNQKIIPDEKTYKKYAEWADKKQSFVQMVADWFSDMFKHALAGVRRLLGKDQKNIIDYNIPLIDNAVKIFNNIFFGGQDFTAGQTPTGEPSEAIPTIQAGAIAALPKGKSRDEMIRDYVKQKLDAGVPEDQIKDALMNSALNMSEEDAQKIIDELKPPKKEPPKTPPPPGGTGGKGPAGAGIVEERSFTKRLMADEKLLPGTRAGVEANLNYIRHQNEMSAAEAEDILSRIPPEQAFSLIAHEGDVRPAVRVVMGMALIKKYNELAATSVDEGDINYFINKSIDVADFVSEKLGTESGQMVQAFSLYSRLSPEAQLRAVARQMKQQAEHHKEKRRNDVNKVGTQLQKANEEAADEVVQSKNVKDKVEKTENKRIQTAKSNIEKARAARDRLLKKYKDNKGKNLYSSVIPGLTAEGIELVGGLVKTYLQEGFANIEIIVEKVKEQLIDLTNKKIKPQVESDIRDIISSQLQEKQNRIVTTGVKELEKAIAAIIKRHFTVEETTKTTLVEKFVDELGLDEADAQELTRQVQEEFDRIATRKKQAILDREIAKVQRIHKNLSCNTRVERKTLADDIIKFSNIGAFNNDQLMEYIGNKLGTGRMTAQQGKEIQRLAEAIAKAPEGTPKNNATRELLAYRAKIKGTSWAEILQAIWYANILSGYQTHIRNFVSTFFNGMLFLGAEFVQDPRSLPVLVIGGLKGVKRGLYEAWHTLTTGESPIHISKIETPMTLERIRFVGGYFNPANYLKFVNRLMVAEDVISFQGLKEMRATQLAYRQAKIMGLKDPFSKATWKSINDNLLNTKERSEEAMEQAKDEGLTKGTTEWKRRIYELMELSRPIQMTQMAYGFAAKGTFNHEPEGTLGAITNQIARTLDINIGGARPLRFIVPFTRIITNVVNNNLDYTPIGFIRAARGVRGFRGFLEPGGPKSAFRKLTDEERRQLVAKSSLGIALTAAAYALTKIPCKNDPKHTMLEITGGGTGSYVHDAQLRQSGWQPYSVRTCGGKYISYKLTPLIYNFAVLGHLSDHDKYSKESDETKMQRLTLAIFQTGQLAVDATFVGSTSDFMKTLSSSTPAALTSNLEKTLGNMAKQAIIPNAYTQAAQKIEQVYNIPQKQVNSFLDNLKQDIPIARNSLNDKVNALGDPVVRDIDILISKETTDPVWKFLLDKNGWIAPVEKKSLMVPTKDLSFERPVTEDEYYEVSKLRGAKLKAAINNIIKNGAMTAQDDRGRTTVTTDDDIQTGTKAAANLTQKELSKILKALSAKATKEAKAELFGTLNND